MTTQQENTKRIAKNTLMLYVCIGVDNSEH